MYTDIKSPEGHKSALSRLFRCFASERGTLGKIVDPHKVKPLRPIMNELRVFKSVGEVLNMRRAGEASGRAFTESMRQEFSKEKDLNAFLQYQFQVNGCDKEAFVPVVAGGEVW